MKRILLTLLLAVSCLSFAHAQEVRDTVVVNDDWRYEGQWPQGEGVLYDNGNGLYIGSFKEGKPEGVCYYISIYQDTKYYGGFKDGKRHGYGTLCRPAGFYYEGSFEDGFPHGEGTMCYPTGFYYKGTFDIGKPVTGTSYFVQSKSEMERILPAIAQPQLTKAQLKWLKDEHALQVKKKKDAKKNKAPKKEEDDFEAPLFYGEGPNSFSKWVNARLVYPMDARAQEREGVVYVKFTVLESGELADPHVLSGSGMPSLDCEALRVVRLSPTWTPGKKDGEDISVTYTLPVIFMLRPPAK